MLTLSLACFPPSLQVINMLNYAKEDSSPLIASKLTSVIVSKNFELSRRPFVLAMEEFDNCIFGEKDFGYKK